MRTGRLKGAGSQLTAAEQASCVGMVRSMQRLSECTMNARRYERKRASQDHLDGSGAAYVTAGKQAV